MRKFENRWLPAQSWWGVNDITSELANWVDAIAEGVLSPLSKTGRADMSIAQNADEIKIKVALPGFQHDEIESEIAGDILTIRAGRRDWPLAENERYLHRERSFESVEEMIKLPGKVDGDKAVASYQNGVLEITVPRSPEARKRSVKVNAIDK
ncbi:MAG: Hsp20/alpha crystallin family protein [Victivallaceae bacterium]|nr:Hsp20/alpha crystallin family protein [Victivallaceae bacterium]